jgi:hypothetical protein
MAISILIRFPISTVQYEDKYMLGIEMDYKATLQASIVNDGGYVPNSALTTEAVLVYDGTLNGDTVIQTDGRDNLFDPLVTSKLKFNIVSHEFPSWLLEATDYYTDVRCCLAVKGSKNEWICEWRGYIWGNTLNSTVVDDWIVTPVFALDELSMAKYIKIHNTLGEWGKSRRLWNYFAFYKSLNDSYFGHIYTWMGLNSTDTIYVDSPYCLKNDNGDALPDLLNELWLDSYMYVNQKEDEEKKTFSDLFTDVCKFLGLTFMVGGRGESPKDSYLLESPEYRVRNENYERIYHDNETPSSIFSATTGQWTGVVPNEKAGASFNITMEPMKYRGCKVTSEAKRYEAHDFLDDDNLEYYNKSKYVLHRWGNPGSNDTIANYCIKNPRFHKLYYMHPTTPEKEYMAVSAVNATTATSYNLMALINFGYIQADLNAQNYDYPKSADTLNYILTKTGAVIVKTGDFDVREDTEDENLTNYLLLMNHKWFNAGWLDDYWAGMHNTAEEALTGNFNEAVELHPFGHHQIRHNQEQHWLKMDYSLICANENLGDLDRFTTTSPYHVDDMRGSEALAMPVTTSDYDYDKESNSYGSKVGSYDESGNIQGYAPIVRWKAKIGDYEYTERGHWVLPSATGFTREFNVNNFPDNMTKTTRPASASTFGYAFCPYYNEMHPKSAGGKRDMLIDVYGYGGPSYPLDGETTLKILNPSICFDWKDNAKIGYLNNIYFLMRDIKFSFTDMAEIMGEDMVYETGDVFDTISKTKVMYKTDFNLCSPKYDGLFYNALQYTYASGKYIANARNFYKQTNLLIGRYMEDWNVNYYCDQLAPNPMTINLQMRYKAGRDESMLFNNHVYIEDMTETPFTFQVRERTIVVNRNIVKFKADRVYDNVWSKMENPPRQVDDMPVDENDYNL